MNKLLYFKEKSSYKKRSWSGRKQLRIIKFNSKNEEKTGFCENEGQRDSRYFTHYLASFSTVQFVYM